MQTSSENAQLVALLPTRSKCFQVSSRLLVACPHGGSAVCVAILQLICPATYPSFMLLQLHKSTAGSVGTRSWEQKPSVRYNMQTLICVSIRYSSMPPEPSSNIGLHTHTHARTHARTSI